jgi:hypothetical protein
MDRRLDFAAVGFGQVLQTFHDLLHYRASLLIAAGTDNQHREQAPRALLDLGHR